MDTPTEQLKELLDQVKPNDRLEFTCHQRKALDIVHGAFVIDSLLKSADEDTEDFGVVGFGDNLYTIGTNTASQWSVELSILALQCGFKDGVPGAVIALAAAVDGLPKPLSDN